MKHRKQTYNQYNIIAAVLMVITLLWLTISTPFIYANDQQQDAYAQANNTNDEQPESDDIPLGNTTEEKAGTSANTLSEYLHYIDELSDLAVSSQQHNCSHDVAVYVAFHGEMLCPPPNLIMS
jgi:hypothetical protein